MKTVNFTTLRAVQPTQARAGLEIAEDLIRLRLEVPLADELALRIESDLAGDVDEPAAAHLRDMRIAGRCGELGRIDEIDHGARSLPFFVHGLCRAIASPFID